MTGPSLHWVVAMTDTRMTPSSSPERPNNKSWFGHVEALLELVCQKLDEVVAALREELHLRRRKTHLNSNRLFRTLVNLVAYSGLTWFQVH